LVFKFKPAYNRQHPDPLYDADADCDHNKWVDILDLVFCFKPNYNTQHEAGYTCPPLP
jgi:hypothetical protein